MKNKTLTSPLLLIFFISLIPGSTVFCQGDSDSVSHSLLDQKLGFDQKYGLDPNLMNGLKYNYPYTNISGDPFLLEEESIGNIQINGKKFIGELIRFDSLNNLVRLDYQDNSNNHQSIILRNEWVEQFEFGDMVFKKITLEGNHERFVQLIFEGNISCYYDWTKEHKLASGAGSHYNYFTDAHKTGILIRDGEEMHFKTKSSFLKHFQKEYKKTIKKYLKSEKIRFNKVNYKEMMAIMKYSNQI
ncbi:MAG: hypothetical protein PF450_08745 [Bacteroidales bacterium]|jgi:transposase|nr:hypothetical protein [Bacteroidales bacterium]